MKNLKGEISGKKNQQKPFLDPVDLYSSRVHWQSDDSVLQDPEERDNRNLASDLIHCLLIRLNSRFESSDHPKTSFEEVAN